MSWRFRYKYGVDREEVEAFVAGSQCVKSFLGKFHSKGSFWSYARSLGMFFKWLRLERGLEFSPEQFLDLLDQKRKGSRVERSWGKNLALAFSRDNPDLEDRSGGYKYLNYFMPVKQFCDYHELPLTSARGVFGKVKKRKHQEPAFTVAFARRVLAALSQRDKAVCLVALQSGQSIGQVLGEVSEMREHVLRMIDAGSCRIRLDFPERKGNSFPYFTYISVDAIQELQKWRVQRRKIVDNLEYDPQWLFITKTGKRYTEDKFLQCFRERLRRRKIWRGPLSVRSHMFRKIFEQEASPPERGISKAYVAFMMGHGNGLDSVGGTYDKRPFFDAKTVENEYAKLEPYLNIYTGSTRDKTSMSPDQISFFEKFSSLLANDPEKQEKFEKFILNL